MNTDAGRLAAYADLVAAVLDLRSPGPAQEFDDALAQAVENGQLSDDVARQLRWLQRQCSRSIVEHAEAVLPAALVALDQSRSAGGRHPVDEQPDATASASGARAVHEDESEYDEVDDDEPAAVVNLQSRRLLVAGLRPLANPTPHRGTLPSVPADPGL